MEGHPLPQPRARRRGAADPAPQRRTRSPARPCWAARPTSEVRALLEGHGYEVPWSSRATTRRGVHRRFAAALDGCLRAHPRDPDGRPAPAAATAAPALAGDRAAHARRAGPARTSSTASRSRAPSAPTRCRCRRCSDNPEHLALLEAWMRSLPARGALRRRRRAARRAAPRSPRTGDLRMSATPARQRRPAARAARPARLRATTRVEVDAPGVDARGVDPPARRDAARHLPATTRDATSGCSAPTRPTATGSARSSRSTDRCLHGRRSTADDDHLVPDGRVMEVLSASTSARAGWRATRSPAGTACSPPTRRSRWSAPRMTDPARQVAGGGRRPAVAGAGAVAEHPAHLDLLAQRPQRLLPPGPGPDRHRDHRSAATSSRVYLPPDANCLLSVADHCLRSRDYVNLIVIDKQPQLQYLDHRRGRARTARRGAGGLGLGRQRRRRRADPDIVLACAGDVADAWRRSPRPSCCASTCPSLRVRVVNVVDLMALLPRRTTTRTAWTEQQFGELFTDRRRRRLRLPRLPAAPSTSCCTAAPTPDRFHVRGFIEQGTTTTPFDMVVLQPDEPLPPGASRRSAAPGACPERRASWPRYCERHARPAPRLHPRAPRGHARGPRLDLDARPEPTASGRGRGRAPRARAPSRGGPRRPRPVFRRAMASNSSETGRWSSTGWRNGRSARTAVAVSPAADALATRYCSDSSSCRMRWTARSVIPTRVAMSRTRASESSQTLRRAVGVVGQESPGAAMG